MTLQGQVTSVATGTFPGFYMTFSAGKIFCLMMDTRAPVPAAGATVMVEGRWSDAIQGYFEVDSFALVPGAGEGK